MAAFFPITLSIAGLISCAGITKGVYRDFRRAYQNIKSADEKQIKE